MRPVSRPITLPRTYHQPERASSEKGLGLGLGLGLGSIERPGVQETRVYKYYDLIMAAFVCVLLCANLIGVSKVTELQIFGTTLTFGAGNLFFPLSYLFGDMLTEVYGYARSRKVVWAGFGALAFASFM